MTSLVSQTPAWQNLARHAEKIRTQSLAQLVLGDAERLTRSTLSLDGLTLNTALNRVDDEALALLVKLAEQQDIAGWRDRMFRGDIINNTEKRAVLHTALRQSAATPVLVDGCDVIPDVRAAQRKMADFVARVRDGVWKGATGHPIRRIVNIGIGGSDLGPRLVVEALNEYTSVLDVRFVANVDAYDLRRCLHDCNPAETLFVVVSKTFTTQETLLNAKSARQWLISRLGEAAVAQHFVAVSTNEDAVKAFGIGEDNIFPMWDWVGGRFSLWSAVGLSIALALGMEHFNALLAGAEEMDKHFRTTPLAQNMPVVLAMLGIWNRNFMGSSALTILPYCERMRNLPRFLQQLEMESNGKSVTRDGVFVDYTTVPALFGDCGTVGQHSFHQCLHQGTDIIPADFIAVKDDDMGKPEHHHALLANMVAQAGAFAFGKPDASAAHQVYAGNRPSNILLLDNLTPINFGKLLALYEHKTFVQGIIWGLNSLDQPGVELGKVMARDLEKAPDTTPKSAFMASLLRVVGQKNPET